VRQATLFDQLAPGDTVSFYTDQNGYRTGTYVRTIERGKDAGLMVIKSTCELRNGRRTVRVAADMVAPA